MLASDGPYVSILLRILLGRQPGNRTHVDGTPAFIAFFFILIKVCRVSLVTRKDGSMNPFYAGDPYSVLPLSRFIIV